MDNGSRVEVEYVTGRWRIFCLNLCWAWKFTLSKYRYKYRYGRIARLIERVKYTKENCK